VDRPGKHTGRVTSGKGRRRKKEPPSFPKKSKTCPRLPLIRPEWGQGGKEEKGERKKKYPLRKKKKKRRERDFPWVGKWMETLIR